VANGIILDGLEIQGSFSSNGLYFWFTGGGLQSIPTYRGEDDVIPQASGRDPGLWTPDVREVSLHGWVAGTSRENFRTRADALLATMDVDSLTTIVVHPPNFGLSTGEVATLSQVRPQRLVAADPSVHWYEGWEVTLEFVCIDSPPDWVLGT
jgi:hypothetical protein